MSSFHLIPKACRYKRHASVGSRAEYNPSSQLNDKRASAHQPREISTGSKTTRHIPPSSGPRDTFYGELAIGKKTLGDTPIGGDILGATS